MPSYDKTVAFYLADHPRILFPLATKHFLIEGYAGELGRFGYERITHKKDAEIPLLPDENLGLSQRHE